MQRVNYWMGREVEDKEKEWSGSAEHDGAATGILMDHRMNPNHAGPVKATLITMLPDAKIKHKLG